MKRVLMLWLVGSTITRYTFVSRIPDNYELPQSTEEVHFLEGIIIEEGDYGYMEELVIQLKPRGEFLTHSVDREFFIF